MSEADNQATSILLPDATLAIFSNDNETLEAGRQLPQDWRFARVKISIKQGGVDAAIAYYQQNTSPDLIIIQTEDIDAAFTAKLEDLSQYLEEGSAAIVIGPVNDVNLYRKLIDMGVSDYLVKPMDQSLMADAVAKTLVAKIGAADSRLIAFLGAKGGVGTTTLAAASAWSIADFLNEKTLFFDGAGGRSTSGVVFGFEPSTTLAEAVRAAEKGDEESFVRMLYPASKKLSVLASGGEVMLENNVSAAQLEGLMDMMMSKFPIVVGDFSAAPAALSKIAVARANHIVIVSTASVSSLRLARSLLQEIKEMRGGEADDVSLLINEEGLAGKNDVHYKEIQEAMEFPVSGIVPFLPEVFHGVEAEGMKLHDTKQGYDIISEIIMPLLQKGLSIHKDPITPEAASPEGVFGGLFNKLKK